MNHQSGFRKGRGTRDQIANMRWIIKKSREFQKNFYFCFIDYAKAFDCVDHNKLWEILKPPSTVGSASCHAGRKEPCALEAPFTCRSKCMVPTRALGLPPWVKPPPWPPLGLPANLPIPRRIPPAPKEPAANPAWCNWLHDPLTPSLLCPSGSTSFPFLTPLGSPSVTPFTGE